MQRLAKLQFGGGDRGIASCWKETPTESDSAIREQWTERGTAALDSQNAMAELLQYWGAY